MNGSSIFKKVLPVIAAILIIIVIAVFATASSNSGNIPAISNPDSVYLKVTEKDNSASYVLTRNEMYNELKNGIGLSSIVTMANIEILKNEKNSDGKSFFEAVSDEDIKKEIETATFGEDVDPNELDEEEKAEKENDFKESMLSGYGYKTDEEISNHYRLVLAKKQYAKVKLEADIKKGLESDEDHEEEAGVVHIHKEDIDKYYEDNYSKSNYVLVVPFKNKELLEVSLQQLGISLEYKNSINRWVHASLSEIKENTEVYEVKKGNDLSVTEVIDAMFALYDMVYGYKGEKFIEGTATLNAEGTGYTLSEGSEYAVIVCENEVKAIATLFNEIKEIAVPGADGSFSEAVKNNVIAKLSEVETKLNAIKAMLVFNKDVEVLSEAIDELKNVINPAEGSESAQTPKPVIELIDNIIVTVGNFEIKKYVFNTSNKDSKLYYDYAELKAYDSNLPSELKNNFDAYVPYANGNSTQSVNPPAAKGQWYAAKPLASGSIYYALLKISEEDAPALTSVREEIISKLTDEKLTEAYIETKMAELRNEYNIKIFDSEIEKEYISAIKSYSVEYKTSKKNNEFVASIEKDGFKKEFKADDLFLYMDKTAGVQTSLSQIAYKRLVNNQKYNKYYDVETGKWNGEEGKELRDIILQSIENQRLYYLSGAYAQYGYDPASVSWEEFMKNVNGAETEKELAMLNLYSEVAKDYINKAIGAIVTDGEGKDIDFIENYSDAVNSEVWALMQERMNGILNEEFSVNGVHLLVSVYETVNDAVSGSSSSSDAAKQVNPSKWTQEQKDLAVELINDVKLYLECAEGTYEAKLQAVVSAFDKAPYELKNEEGVVNNVKVITSNGQECKYVLECAETTVNVSKYKSAGLTLVYQNLGTFTNGKMVKEFNDAAKEIWTADIADENYNRSTVYNDAIETEFGYHLYVNLSSSKATSYAGFNYDNEGNATTETEDRTLPTLAEIRANILLTALTAIDTSLLSEEDAKVVEDKKVELNKIVTAEVKAAIEKYATPVVSELTGSYFSSLIQQTEILGFLDNAEISTPNGAAKQDFANNINYSIKTVFKNNIKSLKEGDQTKFDIPSKFNK